MTGILLKGKRKNNTGSYDCKETIVWNELYIISDEELVTDQTIASMHFQKPNSREDIRMDKRKWLYSRTPRRIKKFY